jgi:hypothetical protein
MERKHTMLQRGKDWYLLQQWSNTETHVLRGHGPVADAPGRSMSPTAAAKLVVQMKKDGWVEVR